MTANQYSQTCSNREGFKSLWEYCSNPRSSFYDRSEPLSNGYFQQDNRLARKAQSYEIDLLRMKIGLMYSNGLQSNQMLFQLSAFVIPLNRRFTS